MIAPDQGVSAPAILFKELLPKEPPTGNELETADAIFATPWLMNSLLGFQFDPSCFEKVRAIAAGSANPTIAIIALGNNNSPNELQSKLNFKETKLPLNSPTTGPE